MASVPHSLTDSPFCSFAISKHQPTISTEAPTLATFPGPVFKTPKPGSGSTTDAGGWTPHFAEDYSMFNSTPGNLRGYQNSFVDPEAAMPSSVFKTTPMWHDHRHTRFFDWNSEVLLFQNSNAPFNPAVLDSMQTIQRPVMEKAYQFQWCFIKTETDRPMLQLKPARCLFQGY